MSTMCSPGSLKVVNSESSKILQELIAESRYISFYSTSNDTNLFLVGYNGSTLHIFSFTNPDKSQVVAFGDADVVSTYFSPKGIYTILGSNKIAFITKSKELWKNKSMFTFTLNASKIVACFPLPTAGIIIFVQQSNCLIVGLSEDPPEWRQIARIDCLEAAKSVHVCLSPLSVPHSPIIFIGTQDGHVYQLEISKKNLTLLCDIQQPVTSILNIDSQTTVILGSHGKISMLNESTKETLVSFAPTAIEDCFYLKNQLYLMGSNQLFSMEIKVSAETSDFLGEANYCNVKLARSVHVKGDTVFVLTENGTIYQSSLLFGSKEDKPSYGENNGAQVKPILQEIHRCADQMTVLSTISEQVLLDVAQLSVVLHIINQDVGNRFPVIIRSFSDPRIPQSQNLIVTITNKSDWNLSSLHWAFQICVHRINQSSVLLREEWKTGKTVELEHQLLLPDDTFDAEVKISLIFRITDLKKQPEPLTLCFIPLATVKLSVLDFLEPAVLNLFDEKNSISDVLGFSRTQIRGCPWPILLQQSWHRGFAQKFGYTSPMQMVLRCGSHLVRMILKEDENHSDKIWILRIQTSNSNLLRLLCTQIFQLIEARHQLIKTDVVTIPSYVLAQLQNLKGRLNYLQSLSNWDESDMEPLMEEFRLLMAKQFSAVQYVVQCD